MESKLIQFYLECLLPEIVDSRIRRGLPVREPDYIKNVMEKKSQGKCNKEKPSNKNKTCNKEIDSTKSYEEKENRNYINMDVNEQEHVEVANYPNNEFCDTVKNIRHLDFSEF